jgi:sugar phosphate isomerase/epimerase
MWTLSGFGDEVSPDLERQCATIDDLGIGHIEFRSAWGANVLDLDDDQLASARQALEAHGIHTSSIASTIGKIAIEKDFEPRLARFQRALQVADALQAPYIRLFSFFIPMGRDPVHHRDEVLRRMAALVRAARGRDVILLHENEKDIYGDIPQRRLDLVESIGTERIRLAWDPANFVQCGVRPFSDGYAMLRPYIEYIHVKDALLGTGQVVPAGQGDGEFPETLQALAAGGFEGFFSIEPHLAGHDRTGGFSGPELFAHATSAFVGLVEAQGIEYPTDRPVR